MLILSKYEAYKRKCEYDSNLYVSIKRILYTLFYTFWLCDFIAQNSCFFCFVGLRYFSCCNNIKNGLDFTKIIILCKFLFEVPNSGALKSPG